MRTLEGFLAVVGGAVIAIGSFIFTHPKLILFVSGLVVGEVFAEVTAQLALLTGPIKSLFLALYMLMVASALLAAEQDRTMSIRLVVALLLSAMGLFIGRVVYYDLLYVGDAALRSQLSGFFGIAMGLFGYMKVKEGEKA